MWARSYQSDRRAQMRRLATLLTLSALACSTAQASTAQPLRVIEFCKQPGARCLDLDDSVETVELQELWWCCPYGGNGLCDLVTSPQFCDPSAEYAVWCEWGRSVEQSTGAGQGIECFW